MASNDAASAIQTVQLQCKIYQSYISHVGEYENLNGSDLYIWCKGRGYYSSSGSWHTIFNPVQVITDLLTNELGLTNEDLNTSDSVLGNAFFSSGKAS